jgi:hypothetical protein
MAPEINENGRRDMNAKTLIAAALVAALVTTAAQAETRLLAASVAMNDRTAIVGGMASLDTESGTDRVYLSVTLSACTAGSGTLRLHDSGDPSTVIDNVPVIKGGDNVADGLFDSLCGVPTAEDYEAAAGEVRKGKAKNAARMIFGGMAAFGEGYNRGVNQARAAQNAGRVQTTCTTYGNTTTCR